LFLAIIFSLTILGLFIGLRFGFQQHAANSDSNANSWAVA
jgi:hypothetical protein